MSEGLRPVTVLIAAMGGEGGGVLMDWIVRAARSLNLPVQATSVPGVAQRTGATTYYVELLETPRPADDAPEPVMDLYPGVGDIDLMISSELVETARAIEKGFVSPARTTLIASTHRVYSILEKISMGDARYDGDRIIAAAGKMAKRRIMFDMERAAGRVGCPMNSIILGAIAGSGQLPIAPEVFEEGIRSGGKAVEANLAGFAAGLAYARGEALEEPPAIESRPKPPALKGAALALRARIENEFPAPTHTILMEAAGRVLDYQDPRYAGLYLDRLTDVLSVDKARADSDYELTREVGRHLALRMTYEDIIRVAQLKTRRSRFERVHREVEAEKGQLVKITEFLKPGVEEYASVLPPFLARRIISWAGKKKSRAAKLQIGMHVRTDTVFGFANLRLVAGLRRLRRRGYRFQQEQKLIDDWLALVREAASADYALALETTECARLLKGYGDTHARGAENFARIAEAVIRPAIAGQVRDAAKAVRRARDSALADPDGKGLAKVLSEFGAGAVGAASPS